MPRLIDPVIPAGTLRDREQPTLVAADGLVLRPWQASDAPVVAAAYNEPTIQYWHHRSMTPEEAWEWVTATAQQWSQETDAEWAVCADQAVVGRVALRDIELMVGQAEVSYWTLPHARGGGVARAGVARVAAWALAEVGFWRLEIRHSTRNQGSCRVAVRAGFRHEALLARQQIHADGWHDVHIHSYLQPEAHGRMQ